MSVVHSVGKENFQAVGWAPSGLEMLAEADSHHQYELEAFHKQVWREGSDVCLHGWAARRLLDLLLKPKPTWDYPGGG